jgi:tRNA(Arg) A34 adenosine deaminase TadA
MNRKYSITAVIYDKRGRVISIGKNSYTKTHTYQAKVASKAGLPHKVFLHAEIHAILKCQDLKRAHKIFVSRYSQDGKALNAKPCPICESAIKEAGIKMVEYTSG